MKNSSVLLVLFCLVISSVSFAQSNLKAGDKFYADGDYFAAAQSYEKYLEKGDKKTKIEYQPYSVKRIIHNKVSNSKTPSREEIVYKIAEANRLNHDFTAAEKWYKEATDSASKIFPLARYYYAVTLHSNKKFQDAENQLEIFLNEYKMDDKIKVDARKELNNLKYARKQLIKKDTSLYKVTKLDTTSINVEGTNNALSWIDEKHFIFTSSRKDSAILIGKKRIDPHTNHLYSVSLQNGVWGSPEKLIFENDTVRQQKGASSLTPDGKKMFFTQWKRIGDRNIAAIFVAEKKGNSWGTPIKLSSNINVDNFISKEPSVTSDGKYLLFTSDMPGGIGGFDIWYAPLDDKFTPGKAINFGSIINTFGDDRSPFYHVPSHSLVFASDGRLGMGGLDIYKSIGEIGSSFKEPINLGYPINSPRDDYYFVSRGKKYLLDDAFISSDRGDVCCPQLYAVKKIYPKKYISGVVLDSATHELLPNTNVVISESKTFKELNNLTTNGNGRYTVEITQLPNVQIKANRIDYNSSKMEVAKISDVNELEEDTLFVQDIYIGKIPPPPIVEVVPVKPIIIYFDYDKDDLRPLSKLKLDTMSMRLKEGKDLVIEIQGNTDGKGDTLYNQKLGLKRAKKSYDYLVKKGISPERLEIKSFGKENPIDSNTLSDGTDNPDGRQLNRRVEFRIIDKKANN